MGTVPQKELLGKMSCDYDSKGNRHDGSYTTTTFNAIYGPFLAAI
jgi:hypothetical protein